MHARVYGYLRLCATAAMLGCEVENGDPGSGSGSGSGLPLAAAEVDVSKLAWDNVALAAQSGYYAKAAAGQEGALRGADLGWTFRHGDKLWIMYGDSWWLDPFNLKNDPDDALGFISLLDFPDGPSVDAFVSAHPAPQGQPAWRAAAPTMDVVMNASGGFAPVITETAGKQHYSGLGGVPVAAFSNGRTGDAEGVFGVFFNYELVSCQNGTCPDGFECDHELGLAGSGYLDAPCAVGSSNSCVAGPGLCQDRKINRYDPSTVLGRATVVPLNHAVGVTNSANPTHFTTQPWATLRFYNCTGRTVTDFDAARAKGEGNDYSPAVGDALPRSGVFLWGRPQFSGIGATGRDVRLYLVWSPMPVPDRNMAFDWTPHYFTGVDAQGRPQFSEREVDAQALDLDADTAGEQPEEIHDSVGQMNVTWVPSLQHFVMFYGGESSGFAEGLIPSDESDQVQHTPKGSMFVRFAKQPWGPWTRPQPLLAAGERATNAQPSDQYAVGGVLAHNNCRTDKCARYDPAYTLDIGRNNNGVLYGPSFIDAWTTADGDATSLYWLLSTWNPYQTVLMKTTLRPE